jgi:hypothetical protein
MDLFAERCAGIDIGKADLKACIRTPWAPRWPAERDSHIRHDDRRCSRAPRVAYRSAGEVGRDGIDRRVLEADLLPT